MSDPEGQNWFDTPGLEYLLTELVPQAAELLTSKERQKPVLLVGPTGAGKTHIKKQILQKADLSDNALPINCAALPENLIESQLFGYKKGAFTGAEKDSLGFFDSDKKVLILDEIGTLQKPLQAKLLTVLETGQYFKVGAIKPEQKKNIKILAMTNENLDSPNFRADFVYRFHVIEVPGLHSRRQDVLYLLRKLIPDMEWAHEDLLRLMAYHWPGNVRELVDFVNLVKCYKTQICARDPKMGGGPSWLTYDRFKNYRFHNRYSCSGVLRLEPFFKVRASVR